LQETIAASFQQTSKIQDLIRSGHIRDGTTNIFDVIMKQPNLLTHFSSLILPSDQNPLKFVNLVANPSPVPAKYYLMNPEGMLVW
jgi:hypothetical protein